MFRCIRFVINLLHEFLFLNCVKTQQKFQIVICGIDAQIKILEIENCSFLLHSDNNIYCLFQNP